MTHEIDQAQPRDATVEPGVPSVIAQLGVEARAEYIRARQRLGLGGEPTEQLGTVGRYRLEAELGRGGMGIVFRASDPELDRPVAVKLVQAVPFARYDKLRTRLLREAKVLAKLTHPNVVRVYDCGQHEGEVYLAMELVEGATLRDWQREQRPRAILDAYRQAARGLAAAHDLGITHRDFKPDNALVASDGRVLVGDFGLAGVLAGDELRTEVSPTEVSTGAQVSATRTGALLGTPTYMAPEQLRGEVATPRSDQFAFCVSLWEALTGVRPFEGDRQEVLLEQIEQGRVRGAERLPRRLRMRLLRGLAVDPKARFEDLRELAEGLVPRRGRVVIAAALSVSLAVGMGVGAGLREEPAVSPLPPCVPPASLDEVAALPQWEYLRQDAQSRSSYDRLVSLLASMRVEAVALCRLPNVEQTRRREWLIQWIERFRNMLESPAIKEPTQLQQIVDDLENERWNAPPPQALINEVVTSLGESYERRLENDLPGALAVADQAVAAAGVRRLELAVAHMWRGRVLALQGNHARAMSDYRKAIDHAVAATYPDAQLVTELLAAKTAAMRLGDLERARDFLAHAHGLLDFLDEPLLSPRRASYHEISAAVFKRSENYDAALIHQGYALFVYAAQGDELDVSMGYNNLGTILELRNHGSDIEYARFCYEHALQALDDHPSSPEWYQAAYNLGHWLVINGGKGDQTTAETLLEAVLAESDDAAPSALTDLVLLELARENDAKAILRARELEALVQDDASRSLSTERRLDAWQSIAIAHASARDLTSFDAARSTFEDVARESFADSLTHAEDVEDNTALLDLTAATFLEGFAPDRARALATSVRDHMVRRLGNARLSEADKRRLRPMLEDAEALIAALESSTSPIDHP